MGATPRRIHGRFVHGGRALRAKKPRIESEPVVETAPEPEPMVAGDVPEPPPGNPLTWTVEQWLSASNVPVDKISGELARLAQQNGAAGIPWMAVKNIWEANTSPAQREEGVRYILTGIVSLVTTGEGPSGHAGAELA